MRILDAEKQINTYLSEISKVNSWELLYKVNKDLKKRKYIKVRIPSSKYDDETKLSIQYIFDSFYGDVENVKVKKDKNYKYIELMLR